MKTIVILNEQHSLMEEQKELLLKRFKSFEVLSVPKDGWSLEEMKDIVNNLHIGAVNIEMKNIIFASPIPALMKLISEEVSMESCNPSEWFVFHNSKREKKELPNGKIVSVVASTGWELV
ncbi:hypothetical protein [Clostridium botulinum]|uniref:hypothetical protein n=1 Tax=Clostridium botulinum TaxID=1491 RepID=UPI0004D00EDB|nr:hypothetical protein [Clostridium botulinum]APC82206.1 hypothetical protein NPD12_3721 [Clostridium botulinum]AXG97778.1 hypothetical protein AGE31_19510 [Clostridium botulinum]MBY6773577.1 hypothetical protein [Clostridium botulinum]MBY6886004.1 hypothetical protein [Clostridium botulinum]